ncbi:MAG: hypothetical protein E7655_03345 [Ruminococcaceae bacterium]|nr:hypothetical protein [Oscillospiraceae bacterium]
MKKALLLLLTFALIAAIAACAPAEPADPAGGSAPASEQTAAPETTAAPIEEDPFDVPADMDGIRQKTIEYFEAMANVKWVAPTRMDYTQSSAITTKLVYEKGRTYYGLPYSSRRQPGVSLGEFEDYLDEKRVYNGPLEYKDLIGGDCGSMRRAWAYGGALCGFGMKLEDWELFVYKNIMNNKQPAIVKIGSYDDSHFVDDIPSVECVMAYNEPEVMYESYALLKSCDLIGSRFRITATSKGCTQHVRMLVKDAEVFRLGNGKIAPSKSYITYSEQTSTMRTVDGKNTTWLLNEQVSFSTLLSGGYVPLSIASLQQTEVTKPVMTASGISTPESFVSSSVLEGTVECNYNIFETEITVTDKDGNVVSHVKNYPYALKATLSELTLSTPVSELPAGDYHLKATATIGFGTKTIAEFDFTK